MSDVIEGRESEAHRRRFLKSVTTKRVVWATVLFCAIIGFVAWKTLERPFANDANLVRTTRPTTSFATTGMSFMNRAYWKYVEWKRMRFPNPLSYSFPASAGPTRCSIHGLLNQCMEVGGVQYLIEKNVAGGSVNFGSTNVLNGEQWVAAFEGALRSGAPEWWDSEMKGFRKENLVFLRYNARTILVLSERTAAEYEKRHPVLRRVSE